MLSGVLVLTTLGTAPAGVADAAPRPTVVGASPDEGRLAARGTTRSGRIAAVRQAVRKARNGAALPRPTTPRLGRQLDRDRADLGRCNYGAPHDNPGGRLCRRGDRSGDRTLVLLGDSHARHWVPGLERYAKQHGWRAYYLAKQACTAAIVANGNPRERRPSEPWAACQQFRSWALDQVARLQPEVVVISTSTPAGGIFTQQGYADTPKQLLAPYRRGMTRLFRQLQRTTDARVVLLKDVPARKAGTDPEPCYRKRGNRMRHCLSPRDVQKSRVRLVNSTVKVAHREGVEVADPTGFFCWQRRCPVALPNGMLPYRNRSHITRAYARRLAAPLARLLRLGG